MCGFNPALFAKVEAAEKAAKAAAAQSAAAQSAAAQSAAAQSAAAPAQSVQQPVAPASGMPRGCHV